MSIYECTMVDSEREPTPDVRYPNVEMVDTEREPTPDVRCCCLLLVGAGETGCGCILVSWC